MDLTTLKFVVDTTELDGAVKKIENLGGAVKGLNTANESLVKTNKNAAASADKLASATDKIGKATEQTEGKTKGLDKLLEKLNNQYSDLVAGFTKGEASILQQARSFGAAENEMLQFTTVLERIKELTKDPFDASVGALRSVTAEFDKLTQRANLAAQGISLSTKQLSEYSRLSAEVAGNVRKMGLDPSTVEGQQRYNTLLKEAQADYLMVAGAANRLTEEEKERNLVLKEIEKAQASSIRANATMMDQAVKDFRQQEQMRASAAEAAADKIVNANRRIAESIDRVNKIAAMVKTGVSESEAGKRVDLESTGVELAQIDRLIAAERELAAAKKATQVASGGSATGMSASAKAAAFLEKELRRVEFALEDTNQQFQISNSNRLLKFKDALSAAGMAGQEAEQMLRRYDAALRATQHKSQRDLEARMRDLSRSVSVQMGDVAVSLASGMNPFMVMIQQGDQLRGAFEQSTLAAKDMQKAMVQAAGQIAQGFIVTGKAIGTFFIGAIQAAGAKISSLTVGPFVQAMAAYKQAALDGANSTMSLTKALTAFNSAYGAAAMAAVPMVLTSVAIALGVLAYTALQVAKAEDELTKSLVTNGAALGVSVDSINDYAETINGFSSGKVVDAFTALAKEGGIFRAEAEKIVPVMLNMQRYLGVSLDESAKKFAALKKDPVDALYDLAEATGRVNTGVLIQIQTLVELGEKQKAVELAVEEWKRVHTESAETIQNELSAIGTAVVEVGKFYDMLKGKIQGLVTGESPLDKLKKQLDDLKNPKGLAIFGLSDEERQRAINLTEKEIAALKAVEANQAELAKSSALAAGAMKRLSEESTKSISPIDKIALQVRKLNDDLELIGKNKGFNSREYAEAVKDVSVITTKLNKEMKDIIEKQGKLTDAQKEALRVNKAYGSDLQSLENIHIELTGAVERQTKAEIEYQKILSSDVYAKYSADQKQALKDARDAADVYERNMRVEIEFHKVRSKILQQYAKDQADRDKAVFDALDNADKLNDELKLETEMLVLQGALIGKTDEERKKALKTRQAEIQLAKEMKEIEALSSINNEDITNELKAAAYERFSQRVKNINTEIANDLAEKYSDFFKGIEKSITESIVTALFEGGKAGRKKLRDLIVAELQKPITLVINAIIKDIVGTPIRELADAISGMSKGGSLVSGAKTAYDVASGGLNVANSAGKLLAKGVGTISKFGGDFLGEIAKDFASGMMSTSSWAQASQAFQAGGSQLAGMVVGSVMNGFSGYAISKAISGGYEANKYVNKIAAVASAIPGIGPIAGVVGGLVNRAFGRKLKEQGIEGNFGGASGFEGNAYTFEKGGWLRSNKTRRSALDTGTQQGLQGNFQLMRLGTKELASTLGLGTAAIDAFTHSIKLNFKGLTDDQITEALDKEFEKIAEGLALAALGSKQYNRAGESNVDTLTRLSTVLGSMNGMFKDLGFSLFQTSIAGADAAQNFADLFGGLEQASGALGEYYSNFFSQEEQIAKTTAKLSETFKSLGIAMPVDRLAYRVEVEKAMAAGNTELAATLIKLSAAFSQISNPLSGLVEDVTTVSETMRSLKDEYSNLSIKLLEVQGYTLAAERAFRRLSTEGMTPAEIAAWDLNRAMEKQIADLVAAAEENKRFSESMKSLSEEETNLRVQIMQLQGNTVAANKELRYLATQGMTGAEIAAWDLNESLRVTISEMQAVQAANEKRSSEAYSLESRLLELQGDTAKLRERELAALDPANRSLLEQIFALEDQKKAAEETAAAIEKVKDAWKDITDSILDEVKRIRGLQTGTSSSNYSMLQSQFQSAVEAARAGDQEAAKSLPGLSSALLELAETQAKSSYELRLIQLQTASSLELVASALAGKYNIVVPSIGTALPTQTTELMNFSSTNGISTVGTSMITGGTSSRVEVLLETLNANIDGLRFEVRANVTHSAKVAKLLDRVTQDGETLSVSFLSPQQVSVV